jgi:hypothetical protein
MATGIGCMNELTVLQTSQGLCQYILSHGGDDLKVVIGYDGPWCLISHISLSLPPPPPTHPITRPWYGCWSDTASVGEGFCVGGGGVGRWWCG